MAIIVYQISKFKQTLFLTKQGNRVTQVICGQKIYNVMKWEFFLFLIQSLQNFTWCCGLFYLSSVQKETGLSKFIAEKFRNLYLTSKLEKCYNHTLQMQ